MTTKQIEQLCTGLRQHAEIDQREALSETSQTHIGLANVLTRLKLQVHPDCELEIERQKPYGLKVSLYIPLHQRTLDINQKEENQKEENAK